MMEFHNRYLEEKNRSDKEKRDRSVNNKFPQIRNDYRRNLEHFEFETNEFIIMVPQRASDITKEGRLQHHCVGATDSYMTKMNERETFILFLRHKQNKNIPYYTLEVKWDGTICQFYAAYDRKPDEEHIISVLDEWKKEIHKRCLELEKKQDKAAEEAGLRVARKEGRVLMYAAG